MTIDINPNPRRIEDCFRNWQIFGTLGVLQSGHVTPDDIAPGGTDGMVLTIDGVDLAWDTAGTSGGGTDFFNY